MTVDFKLYLITDRKQAKMPLPDAIRLALEGGVRAVQLRENDLPVRELLALAQEMRRITTEFGARLFINDHVDIAVAVGADGVHLGHRSMPVEAARKIVGSAMMIGASTHSPEEAKVAASQGADFITYGPIFETTSKPTSKPVGKDSIKAVIYEVDIPVFALGGIRTTNILKVFGAGAKGVAMISAILAADDIKTTSRKIMQAVDFMDRIACDSCTPR